MFRVILSRIIRSTVAEASTTRPEHSRPKRSSNYRSAHRGHITPVYGEILQANLRRIATVCNHRTCGAGERHEGCVVEVFAG